MLFKQTANTGRPTIILFHGGGLSAWSLQAVVERLQDGFHVVTPVIDGHGEEGDTEFISIEDSARKLVGYIDAECGGRVHALGGLSIGAQIVLEALAQRTGIADYAIVESALIYPIKGIGMLASQVYSLAYGLVQRRWFSRMQARTLSLPESMFEEYYRDSQKMTRQSLINLAVSNATYDPGGRLANIDAKVLILVGEKEIDVMKRSARRLHEEIKGSELSLAPGMKHGELSLAYPEKYVELVRSFLAT